MTQYEYPAGFKFPFPPSEQQHAIFQEALYGQTSIVNDATAGAGKTTTLILTVGLLLAGGMAARDIAFVAFNTAIVKELKKKLPPGVEAKTLHSFGLDMLRGHLPKIEEIEQFKFKYADLARAHLADHGLKPRGHKDYKAVSAAAIKLVDAARQRGFDEHGNSDDMELDQLLDDFGMDYPPERQGLITQAARYALAAGEAMAKEGKIDFGDMIWLPFLWELRPRYRYRILMVDEAQDMNRMQHWMIKRALAPDGRLIVVGDPWQSIYGFTGADPEGMDRLARELKATRLPLSVTRRCPKTHVRLAQGIVGTKAIQAAESAPEGEVSLETLESYRKMVKPGDAVLCRTNKPLISEAFGLIAQGQRVKIRGREIGKGLIALAQTVMGESEFSAGGFARRLDLYETEKSKEIGARDDLNDERKEELKGELYDRTGALRTIAERPGVTSMYRLEGEIDALFADDLGDFIFLMTVHKSKGLEFENVFILDAERMPPPHTQHDPKDIRSEECATFVALTRAKKALRFIDGLPRYPAVQRAFYALLDEKEARGAA